MKTTKLVLMSLIMTLASGTVLAKKDQDKKNEQTQEHHDHKVTIVHKPGKPAEEIITISLSALPAHINHGDYILEEPPEPETCFAPTSEDLSGPDLFSNEGNSDATASATVSGCDLQQVEELLDVATGSFSFPHPWNVYSGQVFKLVCEPQPAGVEGGSELVEELDGSITVVINYYCTATEDFDPE